MVMVIIFLTLTNIALGYGLAVYVNRHFGTLIFTRPKNRKAIPQAVVEFPETIAAVAAPPSQPTAHIESAPEPQMSVSATQGIQAKSSESPVTEIAASEQVDEENVLAGIEEFRSQLAKMGAPAEPLAAEPERELVGATN